MEIQRRDFNKMLLAAVGGVITGATVGCGGGEKKGDGKNGGGKDVKSDAHICKGQNGCEKKGNCKSGDKGCKGLNTCKKNGGCASKEWAHECAGKNKCAGQGGCKGGDKGCAGKNTCSTKGGCQVPVKSS